MFGMGGSEALEVRVTESGVDDVTGSLGNMVTAMGALETAAIGVGGAMAAFGATGLAASVSAAADFDSAMQESIAVMGDVDSAMRSDLMDTAREVARTTTMSHTQAAESFYFLASAGLDAADAMAAMPEVAAFAEAGAMDMATATDYATDVAQAFGIEAENLSRVTDTMTAAFTRHNQTAEGMGIAMSYVAPIAAGLGMEIEETAAAIGFLGDAGIKGSRAGTALRGALSRLVNPTAAVQEKLDAMGVSVKDNEGNVKSLSEILGELEAAGASTADIMEIFGTEAGPAMAVLLKEGSDALREETEAMKALDGITRQVAETQKQTLNKQLAILKSNIVDVGVAIGLYLLPPLTQLVKAIAPVVAALAEWIAEGNEGIVVATLLGSVLSGLAMATAGAISAMGGMSAILGVVAGAFTVLTGPIGLAIAAISLFAGAYASNFMGVKTITNQVIGFIIQKFNEFRNNSATFVQAFNWVRQQVAASMGAIGMVVGVVIGKLNGLWQRHATTVRMIVSKAYNGLRTVILGAVAAIYTVVSGAVTRLSGIWYSHSDAIHNAITSGYGMLPPTVGAVIQQIYFAVLNGLAGIQAIFRGHGEAAVSTFSDAYNHLKTAAQIALAALSGLVQSQLNKITVWWDKHGQNVLTSIERIRTTITTAYGNALKWLNRAVTIFLRDLTQVWNQHGKDVLAWLLGWGESLKTQFTTAIEGLKTIAQPILDGLKQLWNEHGTRVKEVITGIVDKLIEFAQQFGYLDEAARPTITTIAKVALVIAGLTNPILTVIGTIGLLYKAWQTNFMGIRTETEGTFTAVKTAIQEGINSAVTFVQTGLDRIRTLWETKLQPLVEQAFVIFEQVKTVIENAMSWVYENVISRWLDQIMKLWEVHGEELSGEIMETYALIQDETSSFLALLGEIFTIGLNAVMTIVKPILGAIILLWEAFGDEILAVLSFAFDLIIGTVGFLMDGILTAITVGLNIIQGDWQEAWTTIVDFFTRTLDGIVSFVTTWGSGFVTAVWNALQQGIQAFIDFGTQLIWGSIIPDIFNAIVAFITTWGGQFLSAIQNAINQVVSFFQTSLSQLQTQITTAWNNIKTAVINTVTQLRTQVTNAWNQLRTQVNNTVNQLRTQITNAWNQIRTQVVNTANQLRTQVTNAVNQLRTQVVNSFNQLRTQAVNAANQLRQQAVNAFNQLRQLATNAVNTLRTQAVNAFNQLRTQATNAVNQLRTQAMNAFNQLRTQATNAVNQLRTQAVNAFNQLRTQATNSVNQLRTQATNAFNQLRTQATNAINQLRTQAINSFNQLRTQATNAVNQLKTQAVNAFNQLKTQAGNAINQLKTTIISAFNDAKSAATGAMNELKSAITGILDEIVGAFDSAFGQVADIAGSIMDKAREAAETAKRFLGMADDNADDAERASARARKAERESAERTRTRNAYSGAATGLATGGIVTRPTLSLIGEGTESEAVIPLSRLNKMLGTAYMAGSAGAPPTSRRKSRPTVVIKNLHTGARTQTEARLVANEFEKALSQRNIIK